MKAWRILILRKTMPVHRRNALGLIIGVSALPLVSPATAEVAQSADGADTAQFRQLYEAEWAWRIAEALNDTPNETISDRLPLIDEATQIRRLQHWRDVKQTLMALDSRKLSDSDQINYRVLVLQIDTFIDQQVFRDYEKPLNSDSAFWSDLPSIGQTTLRDERDYRRYLKLLAQVGPFVAANMVQMKKGAKRGFMPPRVTLAGRDQSAKSGAEGKVEDNAYFQPFLKFPAAFSPELRTALVAEATATVRDQIMPAYQALYVYLRDDYIPKSQTSIAAIDLPDGKAYYQAQIKAYTTLDLTPDAIHKIGLKAVAGIEAEMAAIQTEVGFSGTLKSFTQSLRTDPQFFAKTPEELLMRAAWIAKRFDGKAKDYFGHLPRARFGIIKVPDSIAPYYTSGRGGPGVYLVNTYDLPSRPLYSLPALTLHESAPGHAFQMSLAAEDKTVPEFRRQSYISAFGEGWALYCEKLGLEMGMYETPYERFGMLSYQMWRACRLVIDTGIHTKGWTRKQAQDYLRERTALSDHEVETEVDRYIGWPGQALSYYLGEMTILDERNKAEVALGARFNIRAFHDAILQLGSVPLPLVTERVERFIAEGGKGPYPDEE
jgi:uncharacterized protein (DUF885 family)